MSHSIQNLVTGRLAPGKLTIVDYVAGGEVVASSEIPNTVTIDLVFLGTVPATQNSLAVPLFPLLNAGKIMLFRFTAGAPAEVSATVGLNAVVPFLVHVSQE